MFSVAKMSERKTERSGANNDRTLSVHRFSGMVGPGLVSMSPERKMRMANIICKSTVFDMRDCFEKEKRMLGKNLNERTECDMVRNKWHEEGKYQRQCRLVRI